LTDRLQNAGSFGIWTTKSARQASPGANVSPAPITIAGFDTSAHSISTGAPLPGLPIEINGESSVSSVTVASDAPEFASTATQLTESPIVYGSPTGAAAHT